MTRETESSLCVPKKTVRASSGRGPANCEARVEIKVETEVLKAKSVDGLLTSAWIFAVQMEDSLWPDRVRTLTLLVFPLLSLLDKVSSSDKLHTQGITMRLSVPDSGKKQRGLSGEV